MPICLEDVAEWLELPELVQPGKAQVYSDRSRRMTEEQLGQAADLLKIVWRSPARHDLALVVAGICAKEGYNQGDCEALIVHVCGKTGDPETRDRLLAVRTTYQAAALGQPIKAYSGLEAHLARDSLDYFRQVMEVKPVESKPKVEEDENDPYSIPFRFTERRDLPSFRMLIQGILPSDPRGCVGYLCGLSQSFKSYLSIDWGCHISNGLAWQGNEVSQGQVYYVAAEGQYNDLMSRVRAWEAENKAKAEHLYGQLCPVNLTNEDAIKYLIKKIGKLGIRPRLVILDTLSQCGGDMDENGSDDARRIYRGCKEFGKSFGSTVLIVAHSGKSEGAIIRGSSAFFDDSDFVHQMSRPGWQGGGLDCTLNCRKIKSGRPILNHEMAAREVPWEEEIITRGGNPKTIRGRDLVLIQKIARSKFDSIPLI